MGIKPAELPRKQTMLSLSCWPLVPGHLLCHKLVDPAKQPWRQRLQHSLVPAAKQFLRTIEEPSINVAHWVDHAWSAEQHNSASRHTPSTLMPDSNQCWVLPLIHAQMGNAPSVIYECGMENQTAIILYKDANTHHQIASMVCRFWIMTPSNGSQPHVPISSLDGFGFKEDNLPLYKLYKQLIIRGKSSDP